MKKIVIGFALLAIVMAIAAMFFGCSVRTDEPELTTEAAVTEPIRISEVTTVIKEVISEFVSEKHSDDDGVKPTAYKPVVTKPAATKPAATKPEATKPAATKPVATEPIVTIPSTTAKEPIVCYDSVPATEEDFEAFEELMFDIGQEYNCKSDDALDVAYRIALGHLGGMYRNYYSMDDVELISGVQDPGKIFRYEKVKEGGYEYERYPADKVDFILRNILNVEPDHSYRVSSELYTSEGIVTATWLYYYDGYYYVDFSPAGSTVTDMEIVDVNRRADGLYMIDISTIELEEVLYTTRVIAEVKIIDGERVWSIYEIRWEHGSGF